MSDEQERKQLEPGDRIEYWFTTLDDGRTVHRGVVHGVYEGGAVVVREDYKDDLDAIQASDVIRTL